MDNKKVRFALIIFISASLIALSLALYLNTRGGDAEKSTASIEFAEGDSGADEIIRDILYTSIGGEGSPSWTLKALSGVRLGEVLALREVDLLYTAVKDGEGKYRLRGSNGSFNESLGHIALKGEVKVVAPGGETLRTEHLEYLVSKRIVQTEDAVAFTLNDGISVEGSGFEMDFESGDFIVKRSVRTLIKNRNGAI